MIVLQADNINNNSLSSSLPSEVMICKKVDFPKLWRFEDIVWLTYFLAF